MKASQLHEERFALAVMAHAELNDDERRVLAVLADAEEGSAFHARALATRLTLQFSGDWTRTRILSACRNLGAVGLAEFHRGLVTEDGEPYGSGYAATEMGRFASFDAASKPGGDDL